MREILIQQIRDKNGNKKGFGIAEFINGKKTWESGFLTADQKKAEFEADNLRKYQKALTKYAQLAFKIKGILWEIFL